MKVYLKISFLQPQSGFIYRRFFLRIGYHIQELWNYPDSSPIQNLPDWICQYFFCKRFLNVFPNAHSSALSWYFFTVSRTENNRNVRPYFEGFRRKSVTGHVRHGHYVLLPRPGEPASRAPEHYWRLWDDLRLKLKDKREREREREQVLCHRAI